MVASAMAESNGIKAYSCPYLARALVSGSGLSFTLIGVLTELLHRASLGPSPPWSAFVSRCFGRDNERGRLQVCDHSLACVVFCSPP